jgi:tetratricopeptide (TPR) repeat protein
MAEVYPSELLLQSDRAFQTGNYNEAVRLCYEGLRKFPEFPSFYSLLSQSYIKLGQINKAIEVIEQAVGLFPFQRGFSILLEKLRSEIASAPTSDTGRTIYSSIIELGSKKTFSHYLLSSPTSIFVNVPRNYFATRIDIPKVPKPKNIDLLSSISRLMQPR